MGPTSREEGGDCLGVSPIHAWDATNNCTARLLSCSVTKDTDSSADMGAPALEFTNVTANWNCSAECLLHSTYQSFCTGSLPDALSTCQLDLIFLESRWPELQRTFLQKPQDHLMISSQHFPVTLWPHLSFSQTHFGGTSYTPTSQYTHLELFSLLCTPSSLHNEEMGHFWSDGQKGLFSSLQLFFCILLHHKVALLATKIYKPHLFSIYTFLALYDKKTLFHCYSL